jgi:hypothetical protein
MDQLGGGIRFAVTVDRKLCVDGTRFAVRTLPAMRRQAWTFVGGAVLAMALAVLTVRGSLDDGESLGPALAGAAPLWVICVLLALLGSSPLRARLLASQTLRDTRGPTDVTYRFDADGYEARGPGMTTRLEWSIVTAVAEGDRFVALQAGLRFMVCPAERLTDTERGTIRRWAEEAPGERTWAHRRSQRDTTRLRVAPSPPE